MNSAEMFPLKKNKQKKKTTNSIKSKIENFKLNIWFLKDVGHLDEHFRRLWGPCKQTGSAWESDCPWVQFC